MSKIIHRKMFSSFVKTGETQWTQWNNANGTSVYGFSVEPDVPDDETFVYPEPIVFEIVKVEYLVIHHERKIRVWVKNSSASSPLTGWSCTVYMSEIQP